LRLSLGLHLRSRCRLHGLQRSVRIVLVEPCDATRISERIARASAAGRKPPDIGDELRRIKHRGEGGGLSRSGSFDRMRNQDADCLLLRGAQREG